MVNSHRARMLLPGVADLETLRYFSGLVGEEEVRELTRTTGAGGTTRSTGRRRRPMLAAEALRQLRAGEALLLYGRIAPVLVRLRMWFSDRRLRAMGGSTMSWSETRRRRGATPSVARWPMHAAGCSPRERWMWFEQLWEDTCRLRERYRLPVRSGWWEDEIQVEALAALAAWVDRYDSRRMGRPARQARRCCSSSSGWRCCCETATTRFIRAATGRAFIRFLLESGCEPPEGGER